MSQGRKCRLRHRNAEARLRCSRPRCGRSGAGCPGYCSTAHQPLHEHPKLRVTSPSGDRVHCTARKASGTSASRSRVTSITTGTRNGVPYAIGRARSPARSHSSRKQPSRRRCVVDEITRSSVQSQIWRLTFASRASPPMSSFSSNHTSGRPCAMPPQDNARRRHRRGHSSGKSRIRAGKREEKTLNTRRRTFNA